MESIKDLKVNLESKILSSKKVVIVPHLGIDMDAFSSAIGISLIASKLKKHSVIVIDDQMFKIDYSVKELINSAKNNFNIVNKEKYISTREEDDLFVLTDVNKSNLICLGDELKQENKDNIIIIDHHDIGPTTIESNYSYIDTNASSAVEIIVKLLNTFKIKYSAEISNYFLAGIHLDTNRLTKNATPETFRIVAKLMENGASNSVIDSLFNEDFESHKRVLDLISKAEIHKYSFAVVMAKETQEYTKEELAKVSDYLLRFGVDASFVIGNVDENIISISARSRERINVGEVMKELDGGGNRYSAATKISNENIDEVAKKLVKLMEPPYIIK